MQPATGTHMPHLLPAQQLPPRDAKPHVPEQPEHPLDPPLELPENPPELDPPELDPLGVMQSWPVHVSGERHVLHGLPADPQALLAVPGWQTPLESQQPWGQLLLPQAAEEESSPLVLPVSSPPSSPSAELVSSPENDPDEEVLLTVESSPPEPPYDELP
jgi:hypothetical protein